MKKSFYYDLNVYIFRKSDLIDNLLATRNKRKFPNSKKGERGNYASIEIKRKNVTISTEKK